MSETYQFFSPRGAVVTLDGSQYAEIKGLANAGNVLAATARLREMVSGGAANCAIGNDRVTSLSLIEGRAMVEDVANH